LASTVLEMVHHQHFFMHHLPSLTDFGQLKDDQEILSFLKHMVYGTLAYQTD
jgi:hypothetical protein